MTQTEFVVAIIITIALIVLGLILRTGKGAFLIAGYNTMSDMEKAQWDKDALCKSTGNLLIGIGVVLFAIFCIANLNSPPQWLIMVIVIVLIIGIFCWIVHVNKSKKYKRDKS
jgi:Flp pilus assembly protein TadB